MSTTSSPAQSAPATSSAAWGLRYPGHDDGGGRKELRQGIYRHVAPEAGRRPGCADQGARAGRLAQSAGCDVLGADDQARPDPHGALVRRAYAGLRRLHPVLHLAVRRHAGEVLRRLHPQRRGEPAGGLGQLRRVPDRSGRDRARHRASTSPAARSRRWPATTSRRASASPRSTRRPTGTRRP